MLHRDLGEQPATLAIRPRLMRRDFILSVAALEEEERQRATLEAEQAAERLRRASLAAMRSAVPGVTPLASHAGFLAGLGWEERRVIGGPPRGD